MFNIPEFNAIRIPESIVKRLDDVEKHSAKRKFSKYTHREKQYLKVLFSYKENLDDSEVLLLSQACGMSQSTIRAKFRELRQARKRSKNSMRKFRRNSSLDESNSDIPQPTSCLDKILNENIGCLCLKFLDWDFCCSKCMSKWHNNCILELASLASESNQLSWAFGTVDDIVENGALCPNCLLQKKRFFRFEYD